MSPSSGKMNGILYLLVNYIFIKTYIANGKIIAPELYHSEMSIKIIIPVYTSSMLSNTSISV